MACMQESMEKMIREQGDCLYRFCCNISENFCDAEDLFQDTILKAMEISDKVVAADNPRNYLIGIAIRLERNRRRKVMRRRRITPEAQRFDQETDLLDSIKSDEKSIEDRLIEAEQIQIIRANARQLEPRNQVIAALYYGEGMKVKEIAELVKLPQGTVKSRLSKIRKQLRKGLEAYLDE